MICVPVAVHDIRDDLEASIYGGVEYLLQFDIYQSWPYWRVGMARLTIMRGEDDHGVAEVCTTSDRPRHLHGSLRSPSAGLSIANP